MALQKVFSLFTASFFVASQAFGWGSYGHEQINSAAIDALKGTSLGKCLETNRPLITRLAITPDYDWKMVGTAPTDPALLAKKKTNDHYEHPLHFFEADAFITPEKVSETTVAALPSDAHYSKVVDAYRKALLTNISTVLRIDPSKSLRDPSHPTTHEVTEHGTAPWRILQLYDLGVAELKKGNIELALFYLGAMGHYVGDMSQPFHASLNFDGQYYDPTAGGIHHTFEEAILEEAAKKTGSKMDHTTKLWSTFSATRPGVLASAKAKMAGAAVDRATLLPQTFKLIGSGFSTITPLLAAFSYAKTGELGGYPKEEPGLLNASRVTTLSPQGVRAALHTRSPSTPIAAVRAFLALDYLEPLKAAPSETVLQLANDRMGASSALLAQLWLSATHDALATNPDLSKIAGCAQYAFTDEAAINQYPKPSYLEALP
jgi:hypothetical protein